MRYQGNIQLEKSTKWCEMRTHLQVDLGGRNSHEFSVLAGLSPSMSSFSAYLLNAMPLEFFPFFLFLLGIIHGAIATPIVRIYHSFLSQASNMGHYHLVISWGPQTTIIILQGCQIQHCNKNRFHHSSTPL